MKSSSTRVRSRILITTLSPNTVGKVETRMSISTPRTTVLMRPSCGNRRSAMSSLAMIFMRVVSAARSVAGHESLLLQKSVDSISNGDGVASGFDVHVGCTTLDRPCDDLVHEPNDRRFVGDIAQPLDVEFAAVVACHRDAFGFLGVRLDAGVLIQRPQGAFDFRRSNHGEIDPHVEHIADCLYRLVDEGIGGCDQQAPAVERNRQDPVGLEKGELQSISQNGLFRDICGVDHRKTAIGRVGHAKIAFGNQTELYQDEVKTLGGRLRSPPRPANGGRIDQVLPISRSAKACAKPASLGSAIRLPDRAARPGVTIAGFRMTFARSAVSRGLVGAILGGFLINTSCLTLCLPFLRKYPPKMQGRAASADPTRLPDVARRPLPRMNRLPVRLRPECPALPYSKTGQSGFALVAVIWTLGLITLLGMAVIVGARYRTKTSSNYASVTAAEMAAESAVNLAIATALAATPQQDR